MFAAMISKTRRMRLRLEILSSTGFARVAKLLVARLQGKPGGEREQHQQEQGSEQYSTDQQ